MLLLRLSNRGVGRINRRTMWKDVYRIVWLDFVAENACSSTVTVISQTSRWTIQKKSVYYLPTHPLTIEPLVATTNALTTVPRMSQRLVNCEFYSQWWPVSANLRTNSSKVRKFRFMRLWAYTRTNATTTALRTLSCSPVVLHNQQPGRAACKSLVKFQKK